jgi:hypothetical protein
MRLGVIFSLFPWTAAESIQLVRHNSSAAFDVDQPLEIAFFLEVG